MMIPPSRPAILEMSPRSGSWLGGTDVRVTLTGLYVPDNSPESLPSVMFGSAPAASVSVVVSDMDATILTARTPRASSVDVVPLVIAEKANATFAYTSPGGLATCMAAECEVDAVNGGTLVLQISGIGIITASSIDCTVDGKRASVMSVAATGTATYQVTVTVPGFGQPLGRPLKAAFLAVASSPTSKAFMDLFYRSPPRALSAVFNGDGSSVTITFDQRTDGVGSAVDCRQFIQAETPYSLGDKPLCTWDVEGRLLAVMLGEGAFIDVADRIFIVGAVIKSLNGVSSENPQHGVDVQGPPVALPPR
jgi:hypothetical protein